MIAVGFHPMSALAMSESTIGLRELRARLSHYLSQVKAGDTLVITERGKPVGRIVPVKTSRETRIQEMIQAGLLESWKYRSS